jgi:hypothetical protein
VRRRWRGFPHYAYRMLHGSSLGATLPPARARRARGARTVTERPARLTVAQALPRTPPPRASAPGPLFPRRKLNGWLVVRFSLQRLPQASPETPQPPAGTLARCDCRPLPRLRRCPAAGVSRRLSGRELPPGRSECPPALPPLVVLVKKKGATFGLRSANLQSGGYGGWRPRLSSFAGRRRQVRGRWGAGCLKSLAPEEHFSRFPAARLRGRAVPCAARCGAAAMRSSFRLFVRPNGLFLFFRITLSVQRFLRPGEQT